MSMFADIGAFFFRIWLAIRIGDVKPRRFVSSPHAMPTVLTAVAVACLAHGGAMAQSAVASTQLPTGGVVNAGQANISQVGSTLNVNQSSQRAVVDWTSFNVGQSAIVNFQQPNAQSSTLNRVMDTQPSQILGRITAPGAVVLVNPQGVYFGKSSSVDVGGLVATTHNAVADEYMKGQLKFNRNGATGAVVNEGELRSALGGYIALLAPEVRNQGVIVANLGTVALAAGEAYELQFDGVGALSNVRVTPATLNTLVENKHAISAPGGLVILSAQAASRLQSAVVNNTGRIEATGMVNRGGRIVLEASTQVMNSGTISASNMLGVTNTPTTVGTIDIKTAQFTQAASGVLNVSAVNTFAGNVTLQVADSIYMSGSVLANSVMGSGQSTNYVLGNAMGGRVNLQASRRIDFDGAVLDASGPDGGGRIHLNTPNAPVDSMPLHTMVAMINTTVIRVSSSRAQAGRVDVEGDDIRLDTTRIEATGATMGGTVLLGGDWQGSGTLRQATTVHMSTDSAIDASATDGGNGGKVVLWSDVRNASSVTTAHGTIYAKGGVNGGEGGRIETSGHVLNVNSVTIDASAVSGLNGEWLLDPYNLTIASTFDNNFTTSSSGGTTTYTPSFDISNIHVATITNALNSGTNITVQTGASGTSAGDINVVSAISKTSGTDATLTLSAANNITVYQPITSTSNKLNLSFSTGSGSTTLYSNLTTNGGFISFSGTGNVGVGGDITLNSGGGAVTVGGAVTGVAKLLYETTTSARDASGNIIYTEGYGIGGSDAASAFASSISRITYRMEVNYNGTLYYVNVSFDPWAGATATGISANSLRIPDMTNTSTLQKTVYNMIVSSNQTGGIAGKAFAVTTGSGQTGLIEFWPWNYRPDGGNSTIYDYADTPEYSVNYGSFQIHNQSTGATILAWNNHSVAAQDIGIGSAATGPNPDWTFLGASSLGNKDWKLQVAVNENSSKLTVTAGAGAVNLNGNANNLAGLTVSSNAASSIQGGVSGTGGLTKSGSGTLTLSGSNINAGSVLVNSSGALGSSGTLSFGGGTLQYSASNTTDYSPRISTASGQAYKVDTNGQNVTWATALTSSGATLSKAGTGTLTLSGANTYSGGATVSAGTLKMGVATVGAVGAITSGALGTGDAVVMSGGAIDLNGYTLLNGTTVAATSMRVVCW